MSLEIRCSCRREPLLAMCVRDKNEKYFVHIKQLKNGHIQTEVIVTSGVVRIRCRECERWTTLRILITDIQSKLERLPDTIQV